MWGIENIFTTRLQYHPSVPKMVDKIVRVQMLDHLTGNYNVVAVCLLKFSQMNAVRSMPNQSITFVQVY